MVFSSPHVFYQTNSYDCGIYTLGFGEYILKELVYSLDEGIPVTLDRLTSHFKYLLSNSTMARERYRGMLEGKLLRSKVVE